MFDGNTKDIKAKGDDFYHDLQSYMFHKYNIDRMSLRDDARTEAAHQDWMQFIKDNPEFGRMTKGEISELATEKLAMLFVLCYNSFKIRLLKGMLVCEICSSPIFLIVRL